MGPVPDRVRPAEEHLGEPLEASLAVRFGSRGCRRLVPRFRLKRLRQRFRALPGGRFSECRTCALFTERPGRGAWLRRFRELSRGRLGLFPIRSFGRIQQTEPGRALPPVGTHQSPQRGESRGYPASAFGHPPAETTHCPARLPDLRDRPTDLSVGPAKGPGSSDDPPAEIASGVSDPDCSPRHLLALGRDLANSLPGCRPVLPEISVGRRDSGQDPANPDPDAVEPRPRFSAATRGWRQVRVASLPVSRRGGGGRA